LKNRRPKDILSIQVKGLFQVWLAVCLASVVGIRPAMAQVSVLTYHNNNQRTGANLNETILTPANVNTNSFGKLFSYAVDGMVYAQPLYVPGVTIAGQGTHNVVFIVTEHNSVYAFDADSAGAGGGLLWQRNLGTAAVTVTANFTNTDFGTRYNGGAYTDMVPEVGITSTPVIDLNPGTLYVDAFTHEGANYVHRIHALSITNGAERSFSPVVVAASVPGTGVGTAGGQVAFNAVQQIQRAALTLAGGVVYVAFAGYADTDPYHGWVIGFNATNLLQMTNYVFNTTPNSTTSAFGANAGEGGIWMGDGGLAVDDKTNLFFQTGNGTFTATNGSGGTEYGDSFIKLSTTNHLAVADYFTPNNQAYLADHDSDLGSGGTMLLPDQPGQFPHLLVGAGKEGTIYLINRDQMTTQDNHYDATNSIEFIVQVLPSAIGGSFDTPAYFNGKVYYAGMNDHMEIFSLVNGQFSPAFASSSSSRTNKFPGATPSVSANGTNNGIVWFIQRANPAVLLAFNATNFTTELYNSSQASGGKDQPANGVKFATPTVADGKVFVGGSNSVSVFGLLAGAFAFSSSAFTVPEGNTNATITVNRTGGTNGAVQVSYATIAGGTATNGVDYTGVSGVLNWTNGDSVPKTFTVPILADNLVEPNETVNLALSNPTNNSALGVPATAVLTILESAYNVWKLTHFGVNANNAGVAGDLADPDSDRVANLMEYAFATDPNAADTNTFTGNLVGQQFQLHFRRNTSASNLTYLVQTSSTLLSWSNLMTYTAASGWATNLPGASASESTTNGIPPDQYVNVTITTSTNVTTSGVANQFLRLQVHQ
jgi:Calx-beta domain